MEAINGTKKELVYNRIRLCKLCSGTGGNNVICKICKGRGFIVKKRGKGIYSVDCKHCKKTGIVKINLCK